MAILFSFSQKKTVGFVLAADIEWSPKMEGPSLSVFSACSTHTLSVDRAAAAMDDGFITVEKKFRYKSVNPRKGKRKGRYKFKDPSDYDLQDLLLILSQRK